MEEAREYLYAIGTTKGHYFMAGKDENEAKNRFLTAFPDEEVFVIEQIPDEILSTAMLQSKSLS